MRDEKIENFHYGDIRIDEASVRERLESTVRGLGWQWTIAFIQKRRMSFERLKTIEIGCGTGTFSLTLNLLGADTTLLDADPSALDAARRVFAVYGREAACVKANVTEEAPEELKHKFDIVISGGLVEHFSGEDRARVFRYHRSLMKDDGFSYITAPNNLSPFYHVMRLAMRLAGQWRIETEIPFTPAEIEKIARRSGFREALAMGNHTLAEGFNIYSVALGASLLGPFPKIKKCLKSMLFRHKDDGGAEGAAGGSAFIKEFIDENARRALEKYGSVNFKKSLKDYLGDNLILFGFGDEVEI